MEICPYTVLPWDSEFFGRIIARWNHHEFSPEKAFLALECCRHQKVDCIYCLIAGDDRYSVRCAEKYGLSLVDIRLTLSLQTGESSAGVSRACITRKASAGDLPVLRSLAACSHSQSRFYMDGRFPVLLCNRLYEIWIEKSCVGQSGQVLVALFEDKPVGYVTCDLGADKTGQIGLLAVSESVRGRGVGRQLVSDALDWFRSMDVHDVKVVTQGANCVAQRTYQGLGFRSEKVELWYHWWPE